MNSVLTSQKDQLYILGENIRQRREYIGFTQEKLAEESALSKPTIYRIETAQSVARIDQLIRIAKALATSIDTLLPEAWLKVEKTPDYWLDEMKTILIELTPAQAERPEIM